MRTLIFSLIFGLVITSPLQARIDQVNNPVIIFPRPGEVLQGVVAVSGSTDELGFVSAEVSFANSDDPTRTWFLIATNDQPVSANTLVSWDTTTITDGNYVIRLRVNLSDGSSRDIFVSDLRVRNYTPVETPTQLPTVQEATTFAGIIQDTPSVSTPTALPPNPANLDRLNVSASILFGGLVSIMAFVIIGIYLWLRRKFP